MIVIGCLLLQVLAASLIPGPGQTMVGHSLAVSSLDWARSGHWLLSAGQDNSVKAPVSSISQWVAGVNIWEIFMEHLGKFFEKFEKFSLIRQDNIWIFNREIWK